MIPTRYALQSRPLQNCRLPDAPINDRGLRLLGPGTHNFPMQFFRGQIHIYHLRPFPQTCVGSGGDVHQAERPVPRRESQYFAFEQSFDMGNGTTFTIWEAHRCPHPEEVEYYLSAFR